MFTMQKLASSVQVDLAILQTTFVIKEIHKNMTTFYFSMLTIHPNHMSKKNLEISKLFSFMLLLLRNLTEKEAK